MRRRGFAVASVLFLTLVVLMAALVVGGLAIFQLKSTQYGIQSQRAMFLAEGAVSMALSQIHAGMQTGGTMPTTDIRFQPDSTDAQSYGLVTFTSGGALPWSTINLQGNVPVAGCPVSQSVPPLTCQLLATGVDHGATRTLEVIVNLPPFDYALASQANLTSMFAPLTVKAASSMSNVVSGVTGDPANLGCNGDITAPVATSTVTGDVVCPGNVTMASGAIIGGHVRNGTVSLPVIPMTTYSPAAGAPDCSGVSGDLTLAGVNHANGCECNNLTMQSGLLYVDGDLLVHGGIQGQGAVIATGNITVQQGATLSADNQVAMLCNGNMTLTGPGGTPGTYVQGLVYTRGLFTATNITVAGTVISAPSAVSGGASGVVLNSGVTVIGVPGTSRFSITTGADPATLFGPVLTTGPYNEALPAGYVYPSGVDCSTVTHPGVPQASDLMQALVSGLPPSSTYQSQWLGVLNLAMQEVYGGAANLGPTPYTVSGPIGPQPAWYGPVDYTCWEDSTHMARLVAHRVSLRYNSTTQQFELENPPRIRFEIQQASNSNQQDPNRWTIELGAYTDPASFDAAINTFGYNFGPVNSTQLLNDILQAQTILMNKANQIIGPPGTTQAPVTWTFDMNQFLQDQQPLHIECWRER